MKVTTSCPSRFHIFDQAYQLHRHGVLYKLINTYPKFMTRRWKIPDDKVISLLTTGIYWRIVWEGIQWFGSSTQSRLMASMHNQFSKGLANYLPLESDVFIGLSSFCLEAIYAAQENGIVAIVDHGSLHEQLAHRLQIEESELWGLPTGAPWPPRWLIEKENAEFHAADRVMVLSQVAKRTMVEEGIPAEKIFVNQAGVSLTGFRPARKEDNIFRVVQCGFISLRKGVQYLLEAFSALNLPNSELWFIGPGLKTSPLRPIIQKYHANNIHFKGTIPQHQLRDLYAQGSVFVLASIADGFGVVVSQAMACGLPVIVTENVGASDIVTDGKNGFIIPIRDVEALKEKLLFFYENRNACLEMGQAALETVRVGQTWDDYGDRLVRFLCSVNQWKSG